MRTITKYLSMLMVVLSILVFASQTKAQTTLMTQGWETAGIGTTPPAGWAIDLMGTSNWLSWAASGSYPAATPYEGSRMTIFDSWDATYNLQNRLRMSTSISTVGYVNITVDFAEYYQTVFTGGDGITIQWSTNGSTWTSAGVNWPNYQAGVSLWRVNTQALPAGAAGQATLYIAFLFTSQYGYDVYLDLCHIKGLQTGNLTGTVTNCLTNAPLTGVSVSCGGVGPVLTVGGVYTLNGIPTGPQTLTATLNPTYTPYSSTVTVVANVTTTYSFCMFPLPGILTGIVTNCANNNPVVGVKITWGTYSTYSTAGGAYTLNVYSTGPNALGATKEGFQAFSQTGVSVTYPAPPNTTVNICMSEDTPPPSTPFTAALNPAQTAVNLNWGLPVDDMVLIYDDGIQDNFAIYATGSGNNMNAMKFTPIGYPAIVKKFYVNIGTAANYPAGSNAFSPVQFAIYNETSTGLPGVQLAAPTTITPLAYGWTEWNFTSNVTIPSGDFFIVMIQLGTSSVSPGIAIDTTAQQMRSYSKFGNNPWMPGPGNYMIRAVVNGSGGPLMLDGQSSMPITASAVPGLIYQYAPATVTGFEGSPKVYSEMGYNPDNLMGYQIWRLLQGQEATPAVWTSVGTPSGNSIQDNSYPSLPCDPYRWAAKAQYTFNRWSTAIFSNAVGKCWTCNVTVNVHLSCDSANAAGALVKLQNQDVTDTSYRYVYTATGTHTFTNVWKGNYILTVNKYGYTLYTSNVISIMGDMTINATLLEIKAPPTGLHIPDSTLLATWNPPSMQSTLFNEPFSSGSFATNGWTVESGTNVWYISAYDGNPTYCAEWYYYPEVTNYSQSLTSKNFTGVGSPALKLNYDIYLNNFLATSAENLSVELWDGSTWHLLKNYVNSGSIAYKTETIDISAYTNITFQIRFRVWGADSYNVNWWDIDNVKVTAGQPAGPNPCIYGYNFYLNGIEIGFTQDTFYFIPPAVVVYNTAYHACVLAVYGSGYSTQSCFDFISHFLCPPNTLTGTPIECNAYLSWKKPDCGNCTLAQYLSDDNSGEVGWDINAGALAWLGNKFPLTATQAGVIKSFDLSFMAYGGSTNQQLTIDVFSGAQTLIASSAPFTATAGTWISVPISDIPYTGTFYGMVKWNMVPGTSHYLNQDENGPQHNLALGYYMDPTNGWLTMGAATGYPEGSFLLRANVCENGKKSDAVVVEEKTPEPKTGPIVNILASHVEYPSFTPAPLVTPDAPAANPVLLGYRVWRNNVMIDTINNPNHLQFYDYNLNPGTYSYKVDAVYTVSPPFPPPSPWHSQGAGPVSVTVTCGYPLPFTELWTSGNFTYQGWTFMPNQGNWSISAAVGDPVPCADFSWDPVVTNYDLSLVSPTIDATAWTCAKIYCDFDLKLIDHNATGTEKLDIDIFVGGVWQNKAVLSNSGSFDWTLNHINITPVMGKAFKVRFRAHGPNSANILHWYVDNINIYGVCSPPTLLTGKQNQFTTTLTWHSPKCPSSCTLKSYIYDSGVAGDGYQLSNSQQGNYYPLAASTSGVIKSVDMYFSQLNGTTAQPCVVTFYKPDQTTIFGTSASFNNTGATWPSGTWVNVTCPDIPYNGPFYAMVDYMTGTLKNYFDVDVTSTQTGFPDGLGYIVQGTTWELSYLLGYDDPVTYLERINVCENGAKDKDAPITTLDPMQISAQNGLLHIPGLGALNYARSAAPGLNVAVAPPSTSPEAPAGSLFMGYNVYRADSTSTVFNKIHFGPDTTYIDTHPSTTKDTFWKYFVTAVFQDSLHPGGTLCEPSSDTITIIFPVVGINPLTAGMISLYPNPANDVVNVVSTNDIKTIEVLNYIGQTIYTNNNINLKTLQLNVTSFKAGVYFVKVTTVSGIKTTKITVTH